eukprot:c26371_g1_i1 orf=242-3094(+)
MAVGGDIAGLGSPYPSLEVEFSEDELRETAYEIFAAASRTTSFLERRKPGLIYIPQSLQKATTFSAASKIKVALGLRVRSMDREQFKTHADAKKPLTAKEIVRWQMGISETTDTRIRKALQRTAAGQVGKRAEMILLPLELLQQITLADFDGLEEYQLWQKRQLKVLEAGLLLHPAAKLDQSINGARRLKQLLRDSTERPLETGKNSESMQALRSAATSLAGRNGEDISGGVCHWADGVPFNVHLYQMLLYACFDKTEETTMIDEIDDVLELIKKTWVILGIDEGLHNVCFTWILFFQFVVTGQSQLDLLKATEVQLAEVAKNAKIVKDPQFALVLSSTLNCIQSWAEKRLLAYHDAFPTGGPGLMEYLLPVALNAACILYWDLSQKTSRKCKEIDVAGNRIDVYVRSSLRTAFAQLMEHVDTRRKLVKKENGLPPSLIILAKDTVDLMTKESEKFSPILKRWHFFARGLAAATLHSCFRNELQQRLQEFTVLTPEAVEVMQSADELEKVLVQIVVEDVVDSEDGGKGIIREMIPFDTDSAVANLSKNWIQESLGRLQKWVDRNVQLEDWNPQALRGHHAPSVVEVFRIIEETLDAFFALPVTERSLLIQDLVAGTNQVLQQYVSQAATSCGSKKDYVPSLPALTRSKGKMHHSSFGGLWKRKETVVVSHRPKPQSRVGSLPVSLPNICVRINTLHYIQTELELLEKRIANGWLEGNTPKSFKRTTSTLTETNIVHDSFEQVQIGVCEGIRQLCEVAAYKVVFQDLCSVFWDGLYCGGVEHARISEVIEQLDTKLEVIANTVHGQLRNNVVSELMRVCFEGLLMVLLAGGPSRVFLVSDADMLDEDFLSLKDLFKADGEGLPAEIVEKAAGSLTQVLPLFSVETADLIETLKSALSEAYGDKFNASKLFLPGTTGQWSPFDANTLLRILCYRCDKTASRFLKKTYNLPRG